MIKRKSKLHDLVPTDEPDIVTTMMANQAGAIRQEDIPPSMNVYATMEAAWEDLRQQLFADTPRKIQQDFKWAFYRGVQAAANLGIYCAGQGSFEAAADQLVADICAYEKEAEAVLRERTLEDEPASH